MRRPRRPSRPTRSERRRPRSEPSVETRVVQWHLDAPAIRRHDDGDVAAIPAIEQTQRRSPERRPGRPGRFAQSTRRSVIVQPPGPHACTPHEASRRTIAAVDQASRGTRTSRDRRSPDGLVRPVARVQSGSSLLPALPGLEDEGRAGERREDHEHPEGLSLQHASHRSVTSAVRRRS